eukprot:5544294-Ditylum_brightwellii.AAC.1
MGPPRVRMDVRPIWRGRRAEQRVGRRAAGGIPVVKHTRFKRVCGPGCVISHAAAWRSLPRP